MKYIRLISDVHLDWYAQGFKRLKYPVKDGKRMLESDYLWYPEPMPEDLDTCLIIAGDIWSDNRAFEPRFAGQPEDSWLGKLSKKFKHVVLVLGNHDYWGMSLQRAPVKAAQHGFPNIHVLEKSSVVIDQVKFLGGTLWTDYHNGDPQVMAAIPNIMIADHSAIKFESSMRRVRPYDLFEVHKQTKRYIANNATRDTLEQKVVVVTHMAPSYNSVHEIYKRGSFEDYLSNFAYYSDLDKFIIQYQANIDFWVHGHMHTTADYMIGKTRVLCNAKGYLTESIQHDPWLRIDVNTLEVIKTLDLDTPLV